MSYILGLDFQWGSCFCQKSQPLLGNCTTPDFTQPVQSWHDRRFSVHAVGKIFFYEPRFLSWLHLIMYICKSAPRWKQTAPLSTKRGKCHRKRQHVYRTRIYRNAKGFPAAVLWHVLHSKHIAWRGWVLSWRIIYNRQKLKEVPLLRKEKGKGLRALSECFIRVPCLDL